VNLYQNIVKPFAFRVDAEIVHERAMWAIQRGWFRARPFESPLLQQTLFGVKFPNPLGLAAGFDKNALALDQWSGLGFGFVECGTITHVAQPGNPRPRVFRVPENEALVNRLGFNNEGARRVATRLAESRPGIPVGVNLGKSKIVDLAEAAADYRASFQLTHSFGDYFVINVSSPNTVGLRSLQDRKPLAEIIAEMKHVDADRPLFVKIAPDLDWPAIDEIIELAVKMKLTGLVATNTTLNRNNLHPPVPLEGGLSGRPLFDRSNEILSYLFKKCPREMILMGVGGIFDGHDVYRKISLGAHLCQLYTGWIYGGPTMVPDALETLANLMGKNGIGSLAELRGTSVT
jgi:dihydroorotate dehydrogenase